MSDTLLRSAGVPHGTALAPFLFTPCTADFAYNTSSCHLQKFSVDSVAVALIPGVDEDRVGVGVGGHINNRAY